MKFKLLLVLLFISTFSSAQWNSNPLFTGLFHSQLAPNEVTTCVDDSGNIFLASFHATGGDIRIQKFDSSGNLLWGFQGVLLNSNNNIQRLPAMVPDNSGGCYVAYINDANPLGPYIQHLNYSGTAQFPGYGVRIVTTTGLLWENLQLVRDAQHLFCTMTLEKPSTVNQVYAQKLDLALNPVWDSAGVNVALPNVEYENRACLTDGNGGIYVLYSRYFSTFNQYLQIQHLNQNGIKQWNTVPELNTGKPIGNGKQVFKKYTQNELYICWDGGGNSLNTGIYLSKIGSNGIKVWGASPITVIDTTDLQDRPDMDVDSAGNTYVAWRDRKLVNAHQCYAQMILPNGSIAWNKPAGIDTGYQTNYIFPKLICEEDGLHVFWTQYNTNYEIRTTVIDTAGNELCNPGGIGIVPSGYLNIIDPNILSMPQGGYAIVSTDVNSFTSLYIHYTNSNCIVPVNIEEHSNETAFMIYPNPSAGIVNIKRTSPTPVQSQILTITDQQGRIIKQVEMGPLTNEIRINTEEIPNGLYFIQCGAQIEKWMNVQ